ncbi:MAG: MFS transporter [Pirellulales bacterium]|nr:MFS transporter [Pirellulales bacterium]
MSTTWITSPEEGSSPLTVPMMRNVLDSDAAERAAPADAALCVSANSFADDGREGLLSGSFLGLLLTQFLGALNDNLFRWLVAYIGGDLAVKDPVFRWCISWLNPNMPAEKYKELAVTAGLAMLVLPFLVWAAPAGYLADRFSKRTVIVLCKVAEVVLMILGAAAILYGNVWLMFLILFLMGSQSALFSPSKYGSIPEIVHDRCLSAANGLVGLTTVAAIVLGAVGAGLLAEWTAPAGQSHWEFWASAIVGVAGVGLLTSLMIRRLPVANPRRRLPLNFFAETYRDFRTLCAVRALLLAALGAMLFWSLGGLCQLNIFSFVRSHLHITQESIIGMLVGVLVVGVGAGSIFAGTVSRGKILLVLVPLGIAGLAVSQILLSFIPAAPPDAPSGWTPGLLTAVCLLLLGFSGGMYDVPLQAFLQHRSPENARGSIFAASNFMTFTGTLAASGIYFVSISMLGWSPSTMFLVCGLLLLLLLVVAVRQLPYECTRFAAVALMKLFYRIRVEGLENIPEGGALLTPNHVSYADGLLVGVNSPRDPRMLVYAGHFEKPFFRWFGRLARVIPIKPGKKSIVESLRQARAALQAGELVCVFPEGGITRSGAMREFQPGIMRILKGTDAPVIPVYLDGMWGSVFSFEGGKALWKFPKQFRRRLTLRFGAPIYHPTDEKQIERAVRELGKGVVKPPSALSRTNKEMDRRKE